MTSRLEGVEIPAMSFANILLLFAGIPLFVLGLRSYPALIFLGLGALGWWTAFHRKDEFWKRLFCYAAFYGTVGEAICVAGSWSSSGEGLWSYNFPSLFGWNLPLPVWLPLVWGNLFVLFAALAGKLRSLGLGRRKNEGLRFFLVLLVVAYAGVLFRTIDSRILLVFTPFFTAFLLYWNSISDILLFIIAALLGTAGEILAMREGLWVYTRPMLREEWIVQLGIPGLPISLAMAWGLSAIFLVRISSRRSTV